MGTQNGISLLFINNRVGTSYCLFRLRIIFDKLMMKNWFIDWQNSDLVLTMFVNTTNDFSSDEFWMKTIIIINEINNIFRKPKKTETCIIEKAKNG